MIDDEIMDKVLPVPTLEELKEEKVAELKREGFVITNFKPGGIFYTLLMIVLKMKIELKSLLRSVLNNMFVSHASGIWLDLKMADFSKKRKKPQKTQGLVTVSRLPSGESEKEDILFARGHVFKTAKDVNGDELRYFTIQAATLKPEDMAVDVLVEAEKEGSLYNVPQGQISRSLTYVGEVDIANSADWMTREGSDTEDDESARTRTKRAWSELARRAIEDTFINAAEGVTGVLFAQADCDHPRGQGTVDVIVTGTAGEASEGLLQEVRAAVDTIIGAYDDVLVKSSVTVSQPISVTVTTSDIMPEEEIKAKVAAILVNLLAVRKGRKLHELLHSDINHAIRSGYKETTNVHVTTPPRDIVLDKEKVITLGAVTVDVVRG